MYDIQHTLSQRSTASDDAADPAPGRSSRASRLSRKADAGVAPDAESAVATAAAGSGTSLPALIQRKFESALGADLSSVRVHTGEASANAAAAVGAKAYAVGQDIHFGAGNYDPASPAGERLLAHEVAHTVQQRGGSPARQPKLEVSSPGDASEHAADRAADAMVAGQSFSVGGAGHGIHRDRNQVSAPAKVNGKSWFDFEHKFDDTNWKYATLGASAKLKVGFEKVQLDPAGREIPTQFTAGSAGSLGGEGVKGEYVLAEQRIRRSLMGIAFDGAAKEKVSVELTTEKVNISVGVEARANWAELPWLRGALDGSIVAFGVKWAELKNGEFDKIKFLAPEIGVGLNGEGIVNAGVVGPLKVSVTGQIVASLRPKWPAIAAEVFKQGAQTTGSTGAATGTAAGTTAATSTGAVAGTSATGSTAAAGTSGAATAGSTAAGSTAAAGTSGATAGSTAAAGSTSATAGATSTAAGGGAATTAGAATAAGQAVLVVDTAAVASGAAAIILPLGVAALMVQGGMQMEKNVIASKAAIDAGLKLRSEANAYVKAFTWTLSGGDASGRGADDANAKISAYISATGKDRADACADFVQRNGGRDVMAAAILQELKDDLYRKAVEEFERRFADQFGVIEKLGETWGMRGTFRRELRGTLYAES